MFFQVNCTIVCCWCRGWLSCSMLRLLKLLSILQSLQFSSRWYLHAPKNPYVLHLVSQLFPQHCLWNSSNVLLIDDGPLSSFQGRLSSASSFHTSLLQVIDGVMSLALCPLVVPEASQHLHLLRSKLHSAWFFKVLLHAVCCVTVQVAVCCMIHINTVGNDSAMHYAC